MSLRVIYLRAPNLATPLIRARFWSEWSHCGIVTPDGTVIEATAWHGVREVPLRDVLARASRYEFVDIDCPYPTMGIAWARSQIGKPYDWFGALGIGFNRNWQDDDRWFCSELLEAAVLRAGRVRFREGVYRIDPQTSWAAI